MSEEKENEGMEETVVRNPNAIRDLIYTALSVTEYTQIPILFLGNPGIAKTTGVRTWAKNFNYKVTTLIGTQRVAEEILGYMVNDTGEKKLITYTPDWFDEIMDNKKAGFKTLLFVDELSQAPDNVQGAMLQLIFDRRVGGRANYLPDDCLVVSAANYKGNIPPQCGIQAPTLNRFCLINVGVRDGQSLCDEFLQSDEERLLNIPVFHNVKINDQIESSVRQIMKEALTFLFNTFSRKGEKDACLDFQNTEFSDIFDQPGQIWNFISGRTIHYLYKLALGFIHLGLVRKINGPTMAYFVLGLLGLGTNTFKNADEKENYKASLLGAFQKVIRKSCENNMSEINATELKLQGKTIEKCISEWMRHQESAGSINDVNLHRIMKMIKKTYDPSVEGMKETIVNNFDSTRMLADLQKIYTLNEYLKTSQVLEIQPMVKELSVIIAAYDAYKTAILNSMVN